MTLQALDYALPAALHFLSGHAFDKALQANRLGVQAAGKICRERGDNAAAREHWEKAATQFGASELNEELERTRALTVWICEPGTRRRMNSAVSQPQTRWKRVGRASSSPFAMGFGG